MFLCFFSNYERYSLACCLPFHVVCHGRIKRSSLQLCCLSFQCSAVWIYLSFLQGMPWGLQRSRVDFDVCSSKIWRRARIALSENHICWEIWQCPWLFRLQRGSYGLNQSSSGFECVLQFSPICFIVLCILKWMLFFPSLFKTSSLEDHPKIWSFSWCKI